MSIFLLCCNSLYSRFLVPIWTGYKRINFFEITPFIFFVVNMLLIFGFAFQLPVAMWALTKTRIVNSNFWKDNLRYVVIFLVILGAIITPDGSGITMWFVVGPLMLLYVIGIIAIQIDLRITKYN
nr:twin-arginine translocase subunit TatC [Candidatus Nitrosocosmicus oleophilus]